MGWCHEFGVTVRGGCGHPMTAGEAACRCEVCHVVCEGRFNGCATVWANGPREVALTAPGDDALLPPIGAGPTLGGAEGAPEAPPMATAWPARGEPLSVDEAPTSSTPQTWSDPAAPALAADERGQVFEWLKDSFEGLHSQLRVLSDAVSRQQQALDHMSDARLAAERVSALADVLPERIGEAVHDAIKVRRSPGPGPDPTSRDSVEVSDQREGLTAGNGATAPVSPADQPPADEPTPDKQAAGVRTQLTGLASTVQSRLNRSGWQETLRSLRPAAGWPPEGR